MYFGALKNAKYIQLNTPTDKVHILLIFQSVLQKEKFDDKKNKRKVTVLRSCIKLASRHNPVDLFIML